MTRKQAEVDGAEITQLESVLGHTFERSALLQRALTHRSYVYDLGVVRSPDDAAQTAEFPDLADPSQDNEKLEFMGDAALGLIVAEALCRHFPHSREGELTRLRATLVSRKHLGEVGKRLEIGRWLRLGHTAEKNQGRQNSLLMANAMEALIAAVYLDGGLEAARIFVEREVMAGALPALEHSISGEMLDGEFSGAVGDYKSALQELMQAANLGRPEYVLLQESGPDHRRRFRVAVMLGKELLAEGEGSTKKQAQQQGAGLAVSKLRQRSAVGVTAQGL